MKMWSFIVHVYWFLLRKINLYILYVLYTYNSGLEIDKFKLEDKELTLVFKVEYNYSQVPDKTTNSKFTISTKLDKERRTN